MLDAGNFFVIRQTCDGFFDCVCDSWSHLDECLRFELVMSKAADLSIRLGRHRFVIYSSSEDA